MKYKTPEVYVSWGELIDKLTILEIKSECLSNKDSIDNVRYELKIILKVCKDVFALEDIAIYKSQLLEVNKLLWDIEDAIRDKERLKEFDEQFISLARSVYVTNDKRAAIKKKINVALNSEIHEEKGYKAY